jgi:hypothetical protein
VERRLSSNACKLKVLAFHASDRRLPTRLDGRRGRPSALDRLRAFEDQAGSFSGREPRSCSIVLFSLIYLLAAFGSTFPAKIQTGPSHEMVANGADLVQFIWYVLFVALIIGYSVLDGFDLGVSSVPV